MQDLGSIALLVAAIALLVLAAWFPLRLISCLFSARARSVVRRRWLLHVAWGLFSVAYLAFTLLPVLHAPGNYAVRAKVLEGLSLAAAAKTGIREHRERRGTFPGSNAEANLPPPGELSGTHTESVSVTTGGTITIRYRDTPTLPEDARGRTIVLAPRSTSVGLEWACTGGDMPPEYRSGECRE